MERWNVMTEQPLVSVGLPCYNRPEMLKRAIESIINQTYKNLEIIISNDASPNPYIYEMLDAYAAQDSRIRLFHQKTDLQVYGNYWFVNKEATGKYFMYMQDDDYWELDAIQLMVAELETHPDSMLAIGKSAYVEVNGDIWKAFDFRYNNIVTFIFGERIAFLWMALWRRDILKQFDYTSDDVYGKDIIIMAEAVLSCPFSYIDKLLYYKTIYHEKEKKNVIEDPFCYFRMYGTMLSRIAASKYVKNKWILVVLVPVTALGLVRVYSAKLLFMLPVDHPIRTGVRKIYRALG
jgi:glycosyltransferase involved in cell wall biosynthesis